MRDIVNIIETEHNQKTAAADTTSDSSTSTSATTTTAEEVKPQLELTIIGHSMGAGISTMYAGSFSDTISGKLVLIENLGQLTRPATVAPTQLKNAITEEHKFLSKIYPDKDTAYGKIYPNFDAAVNARLNAVSKYPGNQSISRDGVTAILKRGTCYADAEGAAEEGGGEEGEVDSDSARSVKFRHDACLLLPSYFYSTEEQVAAIIALL